MGGPPVRSLTPLPMWTILVRMKTVSVRDLSDSFSTLEGWLAEGEIICVEKRGQPVAVLRPWGDTQFRVEERPNFAARRRETWGSRVFTDAEVEALRQDEREGEEG